MMTPSAQHPPAERRFASPLSRALARRAGLDLQDVVGTGPRGRIVRADVEAALGGAGMAPATAGQATPAYREIVNSFARKLLARRLTESKQRAPHFYARTDCNMETCLQLRAAAVARAGADGVKPSLNDFVIKAASLALRDVPGVNASFTEVAIRRYEQINIAVAVALDDGLVTPVIADANTKSVMQIAQEIQRLARQARAGSLEPGASGGGTFSISNLGGHGVREFAAVINPPQGAILAVGAAEPRAVVQDGQLAVATMMTVTLSVDHRVIDGVVAARWLAAFRRHLEQPLEDDGWTAPPAVP